MVSVKKTTYNVDLGDLLARDRRAARRGEAALVFQQERRLVYVAGVRAIE